MIAYISQRLLSKMLYAYPSNSFFNHLKSSSLAKTNYTLPPSILYLYLYWKKVTFPVFKAVNAFLAVIAIAAETNLESSY